MTSPREGRWAEWEGWVLEEELRIFGPGGDHLRTIGRQGDGPGEFGNPVGVGIHPVEGTTWVAEPADTVPVPEDETRPHGSGSLAPTGP